MLGKPQSRSQCPRSPVGGIVELWEKPKVMYGFAAFHYNWIQEEQNETLLAVVVRKNDCLIILPTISINRLFF